MSSNSTEYLQDFFPKAPNGCKIEAQSFFSCFSAGSTKNSPLDQEAGVRGLQECLKEKKLYDFCMFSLEKKHPSKLFRVQEEYRHVVEA